MAAVTCLCVAAGALLRCTSRRGDRSSPRLTLRALAAVAIIASLLLFSDFGSAVGPARAVAVAVERAQSPSAVAPAPTCAPGPPACVDACGELLQFIREQRNASSWHDYYEEVVQFLVAAGVAQGAPATLVEVGTAFGGLAHHLLKRVPLLRLVAVDPFLPYDPGDEQSRVLDRVQKKYAARGSTETGSELWARAMRFDMAGAFGSCRYKLVHATSVAAAAASARDPAVDAAFIDGDHTYQGIEADLAAWRPLVREGGLLMFNDYGYEMFPGVKAMVDAHAVMTGQDVIAIGEPRHNNVALRNLPFLAAR